MADSELRREWGTVFAASIGVMASCITLVNYSLGVFVVPLSDEFGWSRRDIALATSYVTTGALLTSFVVGWLADRINVGWLIVASQGFFGIAFCALGAFTDGFDPRPEMIHPAPNGLVGNRDAAFRQQILDVAKAQREPEIEPNRPLNDLRRKPVTGIADFIHQLG